MNMYFDNNFLIRYTREIFTGTSCNLRCKYCYEKDHSQPPVTKEDVKAFLDYIYERDHINGTFKNKGYKSPKINFIGGEPFLYPDLIDYATEIAHNNNLKYGLTERGVISNVITNGTLISTSKDVQNLLKKWGRKISLSISIDGTKETNDANRLDINGNGSYDSIIAGYKLAKDIIGNDLCFAKMTLNHANFHTLSEGVINLFNEGFDKVQCTVVIEENWPEYEEEYVYQQYLPLIDYMIDTKLYKSKLFLPFSRGLTYEKVVSHNPNCSACSDGMCCISPDHHIYGCHHLASNIIHKKESALGVVENNVVNIYNPQILNVISDVWKYRPEKCLTCPISQHCTHCAGAIFENNPDDLGELFRLYNQCGYTKGLHKARMEFKDQVAQAETPQD